jgi:hypothetical protein
MSDLLQALIDGGFSPSNAVRASNAINAAIKLSATTTAASVASVVTRAVSSSAESVVQFTAPVAATTITGSSGIESSRLASFSGDSVFSGPMTISGEVNWGGMTRSPTPVSAVGAMGASGGALFFQPLEFAALNDFGLGQPQQVLFSVSPGSQVQVLTGVSVSGGTTSVTSAQTGAFHPSTTPVTIPTSAVGSVNYSTYSVLSTLSDITATTGTISFPTTFTFNPDTCAVSAGGTQTITYITGVSLSKVERTVAHSITTSPASTSTSNFVTGGTVSVGGPSVSVLASISATTSVGSVGSASGAVVSASLSDPPA